jgi:hypothetical protein
MAGNNYKRGLFFAGCVVFVWPSHRNITHGKKSIILLTMWAIPAVAACVRDICVLVAKPAVNMDRKYVPAKK